MRTRKRRGAGIRPAPGVGTSWHKDAVKAMGLVFGDIGTSPIYTIAIIFATCAPTLTNIMGIVSLIIWTLLIVVTVEYSWLCMGLEHNGEGGTIVLKELLVSTLKKGRLLSVISLISMAGVSLLLGDGVLTPAISILSAVEGIELIPGVANVDRTSLVMLAMLIATMLFTMQRKGTDEVAKIFGPVMLIWFIVLAITGTASIATLPVMLQALNPWHGIQFLASNGLGGFLLLSEVILCATGAEALYADMGHLGRRPIRAAWCFVCIALIINYMGQGAFLAQHPDCKSVLFTMVRSQSPTLYILFLVLTLIATIIASQALISGVFSIIYQSITTRLVPLMRIDYTSSELKSQIYIGAANWALLALVLLVMLSFQQSAKLAAAYGLAVTGTMVITGAMITAIFLLRHSYVKGALAICCTGINAAFLMACLHKLPHGGYWSLIIAGVPFCIMLLWTKGQRAFYSALTPLELDAFLVSYRQVYSKNAIPGTGLFFTRERNAVPCYAVHCFLRSNIAYERNVFATIVRTDKPFGLETRQLEILADGLEWLEIHAGYLEVIDIELILQQHGVHDKVIFYGVEDISTNNPFWRLFALIKKMTPNFVQFYRLPADKLHGVMTRVEM